MMQLEDRQLAQVVEDKITGAGEQLCLWSGEDERRWDAEAGIFRVNNTWFGKIVKYISMTFEIEKPPPPEQLALPLDK